jgi:hypothetical protein
MCISHTITLIRFIFLETNVCKGTSCNDIVETTMLTRRQVSLLSSRNSKTTLSKMKCRSNVVDKSRTTEMEVFILVQKTSIVSQHILK